MTSRWPGLVALAPASLVHRRRPPECPVGLLLPSRSGGRQPSFLPGVFHLGCGVAGAQTAGGALGTCPATWCCLESPKRSRSGSHRHCFPRAVLPILSQPIHPRLWDLFCMLQSVAQALNYWWHRREWDSKPQQHIRITRQWCLRMRLQASHDKLYIFKGYWLSLGKRGKQL